MPTNPSAKPKRLPYDEKVVLLVFATTGIYAFARCATHGIVAIPDYKGLARAAQHIDCPNIGCCAPLTYIADATAYALAN